MTTFSRELVQSGDVHEVTLRGELDMASVGDLAEWLVSVSGSSVVVDLSDLTFMDSSGITALVVAKVAMENNGDQLILRRPRPNVRRILEVTGLGDWIDDGQNGVGPS